MGFFTDKDFTYHAAGGGSANATVAAAVVADHSIIRGDGGVRGVQDSGWLIDDSDVVAAAGNLNMQANDIIGTRGWKCDLSGDDGEYLYSSADNQMEVAIGGADVLIVNQSWVRSAQALRCVDGSAATPGIAFNSDTNTGLHRVGADHVGITTGGTSRWQVNSSGHFIAATRGNKLDVSGDDGEYVYSSADNTLDLVAGGSTAWKCDNNGDLVAGARGNKLDVAGDGGEYIVSDADNALQLYAGGLKGLTVDNTQVWINRVQLLPPSAGGANLGSTSYGFGRLFLTVYARWIETTTPTGVANTAIVYSDDNGSGKTRLMCIFGTGAAQQLAIEP